MSLLPIRVLGPLSECSRSLTVVGQISGAYVKVFTTAGRIVAQFVATWAEQSVPIDIALTATDYIIATQELEGEVSPPSPSPEPVQLAVADIASYPLRLSSPVYTCAGCIGLDGAVPGAEVKVRSASTGEILAEPTAPDGYVNAYLSRGVASGESLSVDQVACGTTGATVTSPPAPAVPLDERQHLPVPRIVPPLSACDRSVAVVGIIPGALVEIERSSGSSANACIPGLTAMLLIAPALTEGETIRVRQRFPSCGFESDWSSPVPVGPAQPIRPPVVEAPLCATVTRIRVRNLRPGAHVVISAISSDGHSFSPIGWAESPASVFDFELPPGSLPAGGAVIALQAVCERRIQSEYSNRVAIGAPPASVTPPSIAGPIHACAGMVRVERLVLGSTVHIEDASTGARLSDVTLASASQADIRVRQLLRVGQVIRAVAVVCTEQVTSEPIVASDVGQLLPPVVDAPIYDGALSVDVDRIERGAIVDLWVDGRLRTSVETGGEVVSIGLDSPLRAHQTVTAWQRFCDRTSEESAAVIVRYPSLFIMSGSRLPRGIAGSSYRFRFTAGGGVAPYVWSISSTLPHGLSLGIDGLLSGTLERFDFGTRDINFAVTVTDSDSSPRYGGFTLPVEAPPAPPIPPPPSPVGHSRLVVNNCDPEGHLLHIWIREAIPGGEWSELGTVSDMRNEYGSCPVGAPFTHELTDGRVFEYAVVDPAGLTCGMNDPDILGCRRMSGFVRGDAHGVSLIVTIPT